jgi:hypothetical protein
MIKLAFSGALLVGLLLNAVLLADVEIAPQPREIMPDGTRAPSPEPTSRKAEDPLQVVDRIIKNSNRVGDKLAKTDIGNDTQDIQNSILKDIQSLIDLEDKTPPPKSGDDKSNEDNKPEQQPEDKSNKKEQPMPMGGMKDMQPMDGMKQQPMPMGGTKEQPMPMGGDEPKGRRPRQTEPNQQKMKEKHPDAGMKPAGSDKQPMSETKKYGSGRPDPQGEPKKVDRSTTLPFEEEIVKDVWGHLPDKLRQQATEYYKQEFMPRYSKLLEHYYSSRLEKSEKK